MAGVWESIVSFTHTVEKVFTQAGPIVKAFEGPFKIFIDSVSGGSPDAPTIVDEASVAEARRDFTERVVSLFMDCCETRRRMFWSIFYLSLIFIFILIGELYTVYSDFRKRSRERRESLHPKPKTQPTIIMMKPTSEHVKPKRSGTISK